MDNINNGMIVLTVILLHIPIKHVNCQDLTVCKYLDAIAVTHYANQDVNTHALFHWMPSETETYFTLTTSGSIYLDDTRITVTFNVFNLGDGIIETLVIQAFTIYGDTVGEWTEEFGGFTTNCVTTTHKDTIYHFGSVPQVSPFYQFVARNIGGFTISFRATVKVKVTENGVNKEYLYYGVQSDPVLPVNPSPCNGVPCHNHGTCTTSGRTFKCTCPPEWTGPQCEAPLQPAPCDPSPCANGGTCQEVSASSFLCECPLGWSGILCHVSSSPCNSSPCMNGAICVEDGSCICLIGWTGDRCQNKTPCIPSPCLNSGYCNFVNEDEFTCSCTQGYHGNTCQFYSPTTVSSSPTHTPPSTHAPCTVETCKNNGECQENPAHSSGYQCLCQDGFHGRHCESPDQLCNPNPCLNDGKCYTSNDSELLCICTSPWKGKLCNEEEERNALIIGTTVGCLLVLPITILLIIRYFYKRRNRISRHRRSDVDPIYFNTQHVAGTVRPGVFSVNVDNNNHDDSQNGAIENQDGLTFDNAGYQSAVIYGRETSTVALEQPTEDRLYESHI